MKNILIALFVLVSGLCLAQEKQRGNIVKQEADDMEELKVMYVNEDVTTHFIATEDVVYVDISNNDIIGDIPVENVVRIKPLKEGANGVVTIATESSLVQYALVYTDEKDKVMTRHNIQYDELRSLLNARHQLTKSDLYDYAGKMMRTRKKYYDVSNTEHGMKIGLNNIYTVGNYFFIDLSMKNRTNIQFDIDQIRFKIEDKRKTKATNFQSIEISPVVSYTDDDSFKKTYRNIFVFEKFTFPEDKVFCIEFAEKQLSGRTITLRISYADVLQADTFEIK